jgi:hypothetical protein
LVTYSKIWLAASEIFEIYCEILEVPGGLLNMNPENELSSMHFVSRILERQSKVYLDLRVLDA